MRSEKNATRRITGFASWFTSRIVYPSAAGLAVFFAYPSIVGYQDIASLASAPIENRWLAHLPESPGGTVLGSVLSPRGTSAPLAPSATGKVEATRTTDISVDVKSGRQPEKINRALKGDRVIQTSIVAPPENFTAGSVIERQSFLAPVDDGKLDLSFAKPLPHDRALKIAAAFTIQEDEPQPRVDPKLPVAVANLVIESAPNVLAYSPEPEVLRSPFAEVIEEDQPINLIPKLGANDHAWAAEPLPLSSFSKREQHCLAAGIYFEARGEPVRGQAAVSQVILNRVKNPAYPDTICGVVYQNKEWRNRCQFSFACDKIKDKVRDPKRWQIAEYVARETTEGRIWLPEVGSSTHYHATYVKPKWASSMRKVGRIGLHIFYRTLGGGWS